MYSENGKLRRAAEYAGSLSWKEEGDDENCVNNGNRRHQHPEQLYLGFDKEKREGLHRLLVLLVENAGKLRVFGFR